MVLTWTHRPWQRISSGWESVVKKTLKAAEQDRPDVAAQRVAHEALQKQLDPSSQLFLDECGVTTNMTRRFARAPRGERAYGKCPVNYGPNVTIVQAIRQDGVAAAFQLEGAIDGEAFLVFIRDVLVPELRPGETVWMDNLGAHHVDGVRQAIEASGVHLRYLPPYSPDFNPTEQAISKFKTFIRARAPRTKKALDEAITQGLDSITAQDTAAWFKFCGYDSSMRQPL